MSAEYAYGESCNLCGAHCVVTYGGLCAECIDKNKSDEYGGTIADALAAASNDNYLVSPFSGSTQQRIIEVCEKIKKMLLEKNRKYGDSAIHPIRVFAKSDTKEQIRVRIDDKLNRLRNQQSDEDEDVVDDLIGYLVLYKIAK